MNIKEGDIVICINNGHQDDTIGEPALTYNKRYVVDYIADDTIGVRNDLDILFGYCDFRFMSEMDYRKAKLDKLNSINE